jgi:adenine deaminase
MKPKSWELANLESVTASLVNTALGKEKADLVVRNGILVNVNSRELIENMDIAIKNGRIALLGKVEQAIGSQTEIINAEGKYVAPGFLDGHIHIESSMLTLTQFAEVVLPHGTTGVFIDPHEIANVLGLKGVKLLLREAESLPLKVYVCVPSCVPSAPNFETTGAKITAADVEKALVWNGVTGLGEVMNFTGVLANNEKMHAKIRAALKCGKIVEGHADGLLDTELAAYAAAGITSCHESTRALDGVQRIRLGMCLMVRESSVWHNLAEVIKSVTKEELDSRHVVLVSDDCDSETLIKHGHVDRLIRRAIEEGVDPIVAIQMVTLNTAEHFGLGREIGSIAPTRCADIVILKNLEKVEVETTIINGKIVAKNQKLIVKLPCVQYPHFAKASVRLKHRIRPEDFIIEVYCRKNRKTVRARVIGVIDGESVTKHLIEMLPTRNRKLEVNLKKDILKVAVVERHKQTGNVGRGLVKGFGLKKGAVASSVAHDSHNLIVVGTNDSDMAKAISVLAEKNGGIVIISNEEIRGLLELPIAGLMSEQSAKTVSHKMRQFKNALTELGCKLREPFMALSFLALPVIPELRITDKGLVDVQKMQFVPIIVDG